MSATDTLVFDMSQVSEGTPNVFVRKDWLSILDNQNQSYQGNQSVIDTSQLANSNKYMNYREAYLTVPMVITMTSNQASGFAPATAGTSADFAVGLKNWYGSVIHSLTLDYNGTTIIQQTPLIGLWNTFKLMTSLSYSDILSQGQTIGFYPDTASSFQLLTSNTVDGTTGSVANNRNFSTVMTVSGAFSQGANWNMGLRERQSWWNFDADGLSSLGGVAKSNILSASKLNALWKSYIFQKQNSSGSVNGVFQVAITGIVYLKHLHSFFERVQLLKGVFMKLTLNLNQSSVSYTSTTSTLVISNLVVNSPLGGVNPLMIASQATSNGGVSTGSAGTVNMTVSLAVGKTVLNSTQSSLSGVLSSPLGASIILNVPAYSFNPVFESAYLSNPIKKVVYEDVYQYQIVNQIGAGANYNNLITNGIANIKSVLVLPFYSQTSVLGSASCIPIQNPFDPAGGGTTSPLCLMSQFNIQISGQNAIYNTERYSIDQFCNQLYGQNAVNGGMTDGLTSGLVGRDDFESSYCYYYVNVGRMLPVEESVPKSVNIIGTNGTLSAIDLYVFVSYGVSVDIDILTGARV